MFLLFSRYKRIIGAGLLAVLMVLAAWIILSWIFYDQDRALRRAYGKIQIGMPMQTVEDVFGLAQLDVVEASPMCDYGAPLAFVHYKTRKVVYGRDLTAVFWFDANLRVMGSSLQYRTRRTWFDACLGYLGIPLNDE